MYAILKIREIALSAELKTTKANKKSHISSIWPRPIVLLSFKFKGITFKLYLQQTLGKLKRS